uniref:Dynein light chain n=1 Tax=Rhinolophus ferrumequinum TaxID=59479 RepID=B2KI84_RHIFE|nr:dynein light chain 1 (predicted) [Rhinolophus ferrumequinum]
MCGRKAVIKNADMSEEMQQDSVECATQALEKYNIEKDIAAHMKKEFDKKYNPTWHCIVGRNFGSYLTHETKNFIYFYLGQVVILLFKSGEKHGLCYTSSDPSKNKDCSLNSKYQRLKSSALPKGTP